jgi:hypothetical protein
VFCAEKEREDGILRRKMLIESRKSFHEAHKNQLCELLCSYVYHRRLSGGLFIAAFTSMPTGHGNPDSNLESLCMQKEKLVTPWLAAISPQLPSLLFTS